MLAIQEENTITHVILDDISNCENADLQTEPEEGKGEAEKEGFSTKDKQCDVESQFDVEMSDVESQFSGTWNDHLIFFQIGEPNG